MAMEELKLEQKAMNDTLLVVLIILAVVIMMIMVVQFLENKDDARFSPLQAVSQMEREYKACKARAPVGFDCYMTPVLMSEGAIATESAK